MSQEEIKKQLSGATSFEQAAGVIYYAIMTQQDQLLGMENVYETKRLTDALKIWNEEYWAGVKGAIKRMRWSNLEDYADAIEQKDYTLIRL